MMSDDVDERDDEAEAAEVAGDAVRAPRENANLLGHEAAEAVLLQAYLSGRLPHAWLIAGPRGVGKATLAFRFARFLLAQGAAAGGLFAERPRSLAIDPAHPAFRRVASGGHADLLVVEREADIARRSPEAFARKRPSREIRVDDTRAVGAFLHLTAAESAWRVVVVDGADLMNGNAQNALLKILEEPPQRAVLLLASDNPGRLLPTIRSRCRTLALKPLPAATVAEALRRYRPELAAADAQLLARLAEGSIGRALDLAAAGGVTLYRSLFKLLERLPEIEGAALHAFAEGITRGDSDAAFRLLGELLPGWLARLVTFAVEGEGGAAGSLLPGEAAAMRRLAGRRNLDQWVEVWEKVGRLFAQADSINLDRKQVVLNAFFALEAAAR
jgi:DNA polymerase-3 subunit delta'